MIVNQSTNQLNARRTPSVVRLINQPHAPPAPMTKQSRRLFARLLALPAVAASRCLSVYLSMPSKEVPTYPQLVDELMQGGGRTVYVPKVSDTFG